MSIAQAIFESFKSRHPESRQSLVCLARAIHTHVTDTLHLPYGADCREFLIDVLEDRNLGIQEFGQLYAERTGLSEFGIESVHPLSALDMKILSKAFLSAEKGPEEQGEVVIHDARKIARGFNDQAKASLLSFLTDEIVQDPEGEPTTCLNIMVDLVNKAVKFSESSNTYAIQLKKNAVCIDGGLSTQERDEDWIDRHVYERRVTQMADVIFGDLLLDIELEHAFRSARRHRGGPKEDPSSPHP